VLATNGRDFRLHHLEAGEWRRCDGLYPWEVLRALPETPEAV